MSVALVTGSGGLIGSEMVEFLIDKGFTVAGIDNNMREYFFGKESSTKLVVNQLKTKYEQKYLHFPIDIRNSYEVDNLFQCYGSDLTVIVHCAAQPSHDWAAKEPLTDFSVNASATVFLLESMRKHCPEAAFVFCSTNKVYGDHPNFLPLKELDSRYEIAESHEYYFKGIDENMSIDQCKHSVFGASKVAADIMAQEYGRYFGMNVGIFRGGCLTGIKHNSAELHGFLAYLVKCVVHRKPYTIFGYKGKQVRDNIHSSDVVSAFWEFIQNPRQGEVYNLGGSVYNNISILEAIQKIELLADRKLNYTINEQARSGDHMWYISNMKKFRDHYPNWKLKKLLPSILAEMVIMELEK